MTDIEVALVFECQDDVLVGVLHRPLSSTSCSRRGVLIVVGGPQYRVGSHRQFVLLARALSEQGYPVLRFDYRGMGDSSGALGNFEQIQTDLRVAVDELVARVPEVREVAIWGLCDAASAALMYANCDPRVGGLVLVNPWVRTEQTMARAYLRHYYADRLLSLGFWGKIVRGEFDFARSLRSMKDLAASAVGRGGAPAPDTEPPEAVPLPPSEGLEPAPAKASVGRPLPDRMLDGLRRFNGRVLLILSGDDLTAAEFKDLVRSSRRWRRSLDRTGVEQRHLAAANHTFSRREWRSQVERWTCEWLERP